MRLVLTGGHVLSPAGPRGEERDIVMEDDTIVDPVPPGTVRDENAKRLDALRRLIIPGLINAHTHSHGGHGLRYCTPRLPAPLAQKMR